MKRTTFALKWPTHIGGKLVDAGTVVATVETEFPCDSVFAVASQVGLVEVDEASELPSPKDDTEPEQVESPTSEPVAAPVEESPAVEQESETVGGTLLSDAGMSESLYSRLAVNEITTVEQLTDYIKKGGDLVDLEDIGTTYAKRIQGWLNSRNSQ